MQLPRRYAIVGTGGRARTYAGALTCPYRETGGLPGLGLCPRPGSEQGQADGTLSRKPSTSASLPSASRWATSNPTTRASAPSGPSSQVNLAWS